MGQPFITIKEITVPPTATVIRVWEAPRSVPVVRLTVFVDTHNLAPTHNITWNVYYGGTWGGAQAFEEGATLTGGTSVANGVLASGSDFADILWAEVGAVPPSKRLGTGPVWGPAVSVSFVNAGATPFPHLTVTIMCAALGDI